MAGKDAVGSPLHSLNLPALPSFYLSLPLAPPLSLSPVPPHNSLEMRSHDMRVSGARRSLPNWLDDHRDLTEAAWAAEPMRRAADMVQRMAERRYVHHPPVCL